MMSLSQPSTQVSMVESRAEHELILCCSRMHVDLETAERIKTLVQEDINWNFLIETALQHGVMPLLYWNLNQICSDLIPTNILSKLQSYFCTNTVHNLALTTELLQILKLFSTHNISALPFKGVSLAAELYENLALRQFGDLDILVSEYDGLKAKELLAAQAGYKVIDKILVTQKGITPIDVDIQWRITRKEFGIDLNFRDLWKRRKVLSLAGTLVPNLAPEDLLLLLCVHGSKHLWERLAWICDVAELIRVYPELNWEIVIVQAQKKGIQRMLFLGLSLANELLDTSLPEKVWRRIQVDSTAKLLASSIRENLFSTADVLLKIDDETFYRGAKNTFFIRIRERVWDRMYFFMYTQGVRWLIPNEKDRAVLALPSSFHFLYYLIRPVRLLLKYKLKPIKDFLGL